MWSVEPTWYLPLYLGVLEPLVACRPTTLGQYSPPIIAWFPQEPPRSLTAIAARLAIGDLKTLCLLLTIGIQLGML